MSFLKVLGLLALTLIMTSCNLPDEVQDVLGDGEIGFNAPTFSVDTIPAITSANIENFSISGSCNRPGTLEVKISNIVKTTKCEGSRFSIANWDLSGIPKISPIQIIITMSDESGGQARKFTANINNYFINFIDNDNSSLGFGGGTFSGTQYTSGELVLNSATNNMEHHQSWTPHYNNLIAYWKLDNDFQDSIGPHHASAAGSPMFLANARLGSHALSFDGANDQLSIPYHSDFNFGSGDFTVGFWFMRDANCNNWDNLALVNRWNTGGVNGTNEWVFSLCNGAYTNAISFQIEGGTTVYTAEVTEDLPAIGVWTHLMGIREGNNMKLYINGRLRATTDITGVTLNNIPTQPTFMGRILAGSGYHSDVKMDDVAIWNTSLDLQQVKTVYNRQAMRYSGEFTSRVLDSHANSHNWNSLSFLSPLPFFKELPGDVDNNGIPDNEQNSYYSQVSQSLSNGLIGNWDFEQNTWTGAANEVRDTSGLGNHGTIEAGAVQTSYGVIGKAGKFNKHAIDIAALTNDINTSNGTISVWFKRQFYYSVNQAHVIFATRVDADNNIELFHHNTDNEFKLKYKAGGITRQINIPQNEIEYDQWYHLVLTWDVGADEIKGYMNGVQYGSTVSSLGTWSGALSIAKIAGNDNSVNDYTGLIDNVSVWNRTLTSAEVLRLYRRVRNTAIRSNFRLGVVTIPIVQERLGLAQMEPQGAFSQST